MSDPAQLAAELFSSKISEAELFQGLGENSSSILGFEDASPEQKRSAGVQWWASHAQDVKKIVCKVATDKEGSSAFIKDVIQIAFAALGAKFGMAVAAYALAIALRKVTAGWCGQAESA